MFTKKIMYMQISVGVSHFHYPRSNTDYIHILYIYNIYNIIYIIYILYIYMCIYISEFLARFEALAKLAQQWLACVLLEYVLCELTKS